MHQHQHIWIQNTVVRTHLSLYHHHHNVYIHQNNLQFIQRQPTLTAAADRIMNCTPNIQIFCKFYKSIVFSEARSAHCCPGLETKCDLIVGGAASGGAQPGGAVTAAALLASVSSFLSQIMNLQPGPTLTLTLSTHVSDNVRNIEYLLIILGEMSLIQILNLQFLKSIVAGHRSSLL